MRVSTSQIFASGARGIGSNQSDLFKLQNQLSTGRKILTPEDDPIASAQVLVLSQSASVSAQLLENQQDAQSKMGIADSQLTSLGDLLQNVRERVIQAGNTALSNQDRSYIAQELEGRFSELMGIANAQDGAGNYLFSGYKGAVRPFSVNTAGAAYAGDDGSRFMQVGASRQMPTNVSGSELFENIRNGNGTFSTATGGNGANINQGTGLIDQGTVNNIGLWNQAVGSGYTNIEIRFSVAAGVTQYQLFDNSAAPAAATALSSTPFDFTPGQSISLNVRDPLTGNVTRDFGVSVAINGTPASGDKFVVAASANQSIFTTLRNTINTLTRGIGSAAAGNSTTEFVNNLDSSLQNFDQALENVTQARTTMGSYLKELDSLGTTTEDLQLQYASSLSNLQDLDWAKAITDLSSKKMQLEAAQLAFKQTSQLSLFNIL